MERRWSDLDLGSVARVIERPLYVLTRHEFHAHRRYLGHLRRKVVCPVEVGKAAVPHLEYMKGVTRLVEQGPHVLVAVRRSS